MAEAMSDRQVEKLAELLLDGLDRRSGRRNTFSQNNARPSRADAGKPSSSKSYNESTMISSLDKMTESFQDTAKRWFKRNRTVSRIPGSALKMAADDLLDNLNKLNTATNNSSKKLTESYKDFVVINKKNNIAQQEAFNLLKDWQKGAEELSKLSSKKNKTDDEKRNFFELQRQIKQTSKSLRKMGIDIPSPNIRSKGASISNKKIVDDQIDAIKKLTKVYNEHIENVKDLNAREIDAREDILKGLKDFGRAMATATLQMGSSLINATESRLQNLQDQNEFINAGLMGMSPQEMNEWKNSNRKTLRLMDNNADAFNKGSQKMLHEIGLFGLDAAKRRTEINQGLMESGIRPSVSAAKSLQDMASKIQLMTGESSEAAFARRKQERSSDAYVTLAAQMGNNKDMLDLLDQQLVTQRKIAMEAGFGAEYSQKLLQENLNARHKSIIDKVKGTALLPVQQKAIEELIGRALSSEEVLGLRSTVTGDNSIEAQRGRQSLTKATGTAYEALNQRQASSVAQGAGVGGVLNQSGSMAVVRLERIGFGQLPEWGTEGSRATVKTATEGAAVKSLGDLDQVIAAQRKTLTAMEEFFLTATNELGAGVAKSPVGGMLGAAGSFAGDVLKYTIGTKLGNIGLRGAASVGGRALSAVGGLRGLGMGLAKGGGIGLAANLAESGVDYLGEKAFGENSRGSGITNTLAKTGSWAATGAAIGSIIPVIGTGVGAIAGGVAGLGKGLYDNWNSISGAEKAATSGTLLDANGNEITLDSEEQTKLLRKVVENTELTAEATKEGNKDRKDIAQGSDAIQRYQDLQRESAQLKLQARAASLQTSAGMAVDRISNRSLSNI